MECDGKKRDMYKKRNSQNKIQYYLIIINGKQSVNFTSSAFKIGVGDEQTHHDINLYAQGN